MSEVERTGWYAERAQVEGQRDDLARALGDLLTHLGITRPAPLTGPELLHFSKEAMSVDYAGILGRVEALIHEWDNNLDSEPSAHSHVWRRAEAELRAAWKGAEA